MGDVSPIVPPPPPTPGWLEVLKSTVFRRVASAIAGIALIAACGLLPVNAQGICKQIVGAVQTIVDQLQPAGADPLQQFRERAGAPRADPRPACTPSEAADVCLSNGYAVPFPDGGSCACPR